MKYRIEYWVGSRSSGYFGIRTILFPERLEVFTTGNAQVVIFWVVTPYLTANEMQKKI
jgi:hypothetical protein